MDDLIGLVRMMRLIKRDSFQRFMEFAINCAAEYIKREYERRRGVA